MPRVSVVIPVYGVEQFVEAAVRSVLKQSFEDFEVIIVNDKSPDRSLEICESIKDPRIKIVTHLENRGLAGARNTGIRHATGDYIGLLDSDDLWEPNKLQSHVDHLDANPKVGVSFSRSAFIDEQGTHLNTYQMPKLSDISVAHLMCRNPVGNGSAPVIRKEVFEEIATMENIHGVKEPHYFDDSFRQSEDIECWIRIAATTNWQFEGLSEPLTMYRINSASLSANIPKQLASWERVMDKLKSYSPELWSNHVSLARAFQLRYLARQAIRQKDGLTSLSLVGQAFKSNPKMLIKEPGRTLLTLAAAIALVIVPKNVYQKMEPLGISLVGRTQQLRIGMR